jgi:hypothetical protein
MLDKSTMQYSRYSHAYLTVKIALTIALLGRGQASGSKPTRSTMQSNDRAVVDVVQRCAVILQERSHYVYGKNARVLTNFSPFSTQF